MAENIGENLRRSMGYSNRFLADSEFGVHITPEQLYKAVVFFAVIYVAGAVFSKVLKMPSLVGEIFAGIILGPPLLDFIPNPEAFVLLGEVGLILLVLEAGIDIDLATIKLIGTRGVIIAVIGSILPIVVAFGLALAINTDFKGAIAAGAAFGPTSLGIAMNILRQGKIVNTPVGQLIVSAAVIDDMIALVILSQLKALTGDVSIKNVLIPIVSSLSFLLLGGYCAVFIVPGLVGKFLNIAVPEEHHPQVSLAIMIALILGLIPACLYGEASLLMGVFIAGLSFCRDHEVHHLFVSQFKRLLQWLMRIFFAASIGFQVPIKDFGNSKVILQGLLLTLALSGKLAVGFLVPNFNRTPRFTGLHLRDCLVTGLSMAAEGEFAFVIAVYCVDNGLITPDLYASIVLAVLISTIIPPFSLRFTIAYYNKKAQNMIQESAKVEFDRKMSIESERDDEGDLEVNLRNEIKNQTTVFFCIQTQSQSRWGLLPAIMGKMKNMHLDIIDHRSWHPRGVDSTLVNEIYAKGSIEVQPGNSAVNLDEKMHDIEEKLIDLLDQEDAQVKVHRWFPGVLSEIVEEVVNVDPTVSHSLCVSDKIAHEAAVILEKKRQLQTTATTKKSVEEILKSNTNMIVGGGSLLQNKESEVRRTKRVKMRSTPAMGGDMFGGGGESVVGSLNGTVSSRLSGKSSPYRRVAKSKSSFAARSRTTYAAEIMVGRESFNVEISGSTLARLRKSEGYTMLNDNDVQASVNTSQMEHALSGYVRIPLSRIEELPSSERNSTNDDESQASA